MSSSIVGSRPSSFVVKGEEHLEEEEDGEDTEEEKYGVQECKEVMVDEKACDGGGREGGEKGGGGRGGYHPGHIALVMEEEEREEGQGVVPPSPQSVSSRYKKLSKGVMMWLKAKTGDRNRHPTTIPPPIDADHHPWSWVNSHDELITVMDNGQVFYGFQEGQIEFPPSFRWRRSCYGGDYDRVRRRVVVGGGGGGGGRRRRRNEEW